MSWRWISECKVWVGRAHLGGARWLLHSVAIAAFAATTIVVAFAAGADAQGGVEWTEADEGGEEWDGTEGSDPGVIDDAVGNEAEAEDDAEGAIDSSDVWFHVRIWVRGVNVCWP